MLRNSRYAWWWLLVVISLVLNIILLRQWIAFRQQMGTLEAVAERALTQAIADLDSLQQTTVSVNLQIREDVPVRLSVPIQQTLEVPISTTIPVHQNVRTTVSVTVPGVGVAVPVPITVPLNLQVPVDLQVPVVISRSLPLSTTIPVDMNAPVQVDLARTGIAAYLGRLRASLISLRDAIAGTP